MHELETAVQPQAQRNETPLLVVTEG